MAELIVGLFLQHLLDLVLNGLVEKLGRRSLEQLIGCFLVGFFLLLFRLLDSLLVLRRGLNRFMIKGRCSPFE